ncbi:ribonuclease H-like domain-containing protein [Tanacetum coccineum]
MSKGNGTGERKPTWNNVQRVNKQNQFVPLAVQTRTGNNPVNTAKASSTNNFSTARQKVNKQTVLTSTALKVNTVKPIVNGVRPANVFHKTHSPSSRPFKRTTVLRTNFSNQKVYTAKDNPHRTLKNKGIIDSGCSRHMTGNKAYLADFQDFNGGPVAFGGSKGYIWKRKIKTGKLDFEDVSFVKELQHFNLFSVSQMCDKKNKVLFTDSECLVLSPDFKLPDENQILLKVPRQNNMYSFNLENIVPSGGLACLIAKATTDESNKWHRRLGHVNFKNLNRLVKGPFRGIKREYSNARTPQQNGVAKRKNMTLIEAARTMLADSFLPNTFWAEAVSQQESKQNTGTKDKIDAGDSKQEDESAQDCFELPIWHSYSSTNPFASKYAGDSEKEDESAQDCFELPIWHSILRQTHLLQNQIIDREVKREEQVFLDDLARLQRQEKEANEEAEALRKNLEQETENLVTQAGAAKSSISTASPNEGLSLSDTTNSQEDDSEIPPLEDIIKITTMYFTHSSYDDEGAEADFTIGNSCESLENKQAGLMSMQEELLQFKFKSLDPSRFALMEKGYRYKVEYRNKKRKGGVVIDGRGVCAQPPVFLDPNILRKSTKFCACSRFQVTPKTSHLSAVKRIFRKIHNRRLSIFLARDSYLAMQKSKPLMATLSTEAKMLAATSSVGNGSSVDERGKTHHGKSNLFQETPKPLCSTFLPTDVKHCLNVGYTFVNFTTSEAVWKSHVCITRKSWLLFKSKKIAQVVRAWIQSKNSLVKHFEDMRLCRPSKEYLPVWFDPPRDVSMSCLTTKGMRNNGAMCASNMAALESCPKHNMIAYLEKTEGNVEFHEVIDFLREVKFLHALHRKVFVSTTFREHFRMSAKSKTITMLGHNWPKYLAILCYPLRHQSEQFYFDDADGIDSLPNQAKL